MKQIMLRAMFFFHETIFEIIRQKQFSCYAIYNLREDQIIEFTNWKFKDNSREKAFELLRYAQKSCPCA
jgi:hypothetical protein